MASLYHIDCLCDSDDADIQYASFFLPDALLPSRRSRRRVLPGIKNPQYYRQTVAVGSLRLGLSGLSGPLCFLLLLHRHGLLRCLRYIHDSSFTSLSARSTAEGCSLHSSLCRLSPHLSSLSQFFKNIYITTLISSYLSYNQIDNIWI